MSEREAGKESRGGGSDLENMKAFVSHCRKFGLNTKVGESQEQGAVRREASLRLLQQISSLMEEIGGIWEPTISETE